MPSVWSMKGEYFEACNCDVACPCIFGSDPTRGQCTAVVAWHIDQGSFGSHSLDGLNFVIAVYCAGNMETNPWEVAIYLDARATEPQRKALETILTGKAGGRFGDIASAFGTVRGIRSLPIEFQVSGKKRSIKIQAVADVRVQAFTARGGDDRKISPGPFSPEIVVAKSEKFTLDDHGWKWDFSEKTSFYSPFSYEGPPLGTQTTEAHHPLL
ncbi:MAG: DUF1326 domain-containing protein [Thermoplasmata archaeon]|nr:DUF1326 domain-containing protein [Thermoplasmata archaeon]